MNDSRYHHVPPLLPDDDLRKSDTDYISMIGADKGKTFAEVLAEVQKRNPRAYTENPEILLSRPASEWLACGSKGKPEDKLFGPFWRKGELSVLFSAAGLGKSALATQIAESLARGVSIAPFEHAIAPERVLYLDFELDCSQLALRYSRYDPEYGVCATPYQFAPGFLRAEMCWNGYVIDGYNGFSDMFFKSVDNEIDHHDITVLIVDNITFLDISSTSNVNTALSIMRNLCDLKKMRFISILVLAHTPKRRPWRPLTENDLQGSINIANFADSMFAVGGSRHSRDLRYLKQIKVRSSAPEYGKECVPIYKLAKFDNAARLGLAQDREIPQVDNFLGYEFVEFAPEEDHLDRPPRGGSLFRQDPKAKKKSIVENVKLLAAEGKTAGKIANELNLPKTTVYRYMQAG